MSQDVIFKMKKGASDVKIDFRYEDSRIKKDEPIPKNKIKIIAGEGELKIKVDVGRKGNKDVAKWYKDFVDGNTLYMMHTKNGSNKPDKLNFAIKGKLIIGEKEYSVCFGQGHYLTVNNWHLCSYDILARANNKSAYLNNIYYIETSGSNKFTMIFADEINKGKGVTLWAFTNSESTTPRFDMEGDTLHPFPYQKSNLKNVGEMQKGKAYDSTGIFPANREFHLQIIAEDNQEQLKEVLYKINRVTGAIEGPKVLNQTVISYKNEFGNAFLMNYGMSHAAQPLTNQSYIYTGPEIRNWMEVIVNDCPDIKIKELVLPGSHDAGMFEMNGNLDLPWFTALIMAFVTSIFTICSSVIDVILIKDGTKIALENLSITQKDNSYDQMLIGTRYFDFRPAYNKSESIEKTYHLHDFVPGVLFEEFLEGINKYLLKYKQEIAIIRISKSGIDKDNFTPLSKDEVEEFMKDTISEEVGYDFPEDLKAYHNQSLQQVIDLGKRVLVLYGTFEINDSYNGNDYTRSLTNTSYVISALNNTIENQGDYDYTLLQLQNTGSGAIMRYTGDIAANCTAWANDILGSKTGNILQATKPIFDHDTYQWLTENDVIKGITNQNCPVIIQNDFVDIALTTHAIALSKEIYEKRNEQV